ncbi:MAG: M14 family metallopeptidase [Bryobacteraceae bacterium]|nr:M14 family metallopeptidase [Bryobacteraceae bacterium]
MPALLPLALLLAPPPISPQSQAETPAMREAASVAESTAAAPNGWLTHAEQTAFRQTGRYDEAVAFYRRLAAASRHARLAPIGETAEGRPLFALIVSRDRAFTPEAARKTGKPVVLLQNGIHAGENGGKDAAMMLLRDVLVTRRHAAWLDHIILISIPVFNADGHEHVSPFNRINENGPAEMGFRVTANRLNLNRDYLKADTPEMRAWLKLYTAWLPDFLIDNHVTDGSDNQYDVTISVHTEQDIAPEIGAWAKRRYVPELERRMAALGHVMGWYMGFSRAGFAIPVQSYSPRYSTGYAAAQNRAALLVETHSLKSFRTRVWSHYDIMRVTLDIIAAAPKDLRQASLAADRAAEALQPGAKVFLEGIPSSGSEPYTLRLLEAERYTGAASGGPVARYTARPLNQQVRIVRTLAEKLALPAPAGYIVPREWREVIALLHAHGVKTEPLPKPLEAQFETWRFENVQFATRPFEGRFQVVSFTAKPVREPRWLAPSSVWVPAAQRAGKVAMHILEPEAPDSALRWGFFLPIFEQKEYFSDYLFEPYATAMLDSDPALKAEFEKALAANPDLAKAPRARLEWLYRRSPYYESGKDAYPVVKAMAKPF